MSARKTAVFDPKELRNSIAPNIDDWAHGRIGWGTGFVSNDAVKVLLEFLESKTPLCPGNLNTVEYRRMVEIAMVCARGNIADSHNVRNSVESHVQTCLELRRGLLNRWDREYLQEILVTAGSAKRVRDLS